VCADVAAEEGARIGQFRKAANVVRTRIELVSGVLRVFVAKVAPAITAVNGDSNESATRTYDVAILLGPETASRVTGFVTRPIGSVSLKGRVQSLEVYALLGRDPGAPAPGPASVLYHPDASPDA
jgi:hypothetical protein